MYISIFDSINLIKTDWKHIILKQRSELEKIDNYLLSLHEKNIVTYPPPHLIFNAFNHFNFNDTKVILIGQDCYINEGEAMGLCFSVPNGNKIPPSLANIFKELKDDVKCNIPISGDLIKWAEQGVLLLNASLTVTAHISNSHSKIWKIFTDNIICDISNNLSNKVFMLWGKFAEKKCISIDNNKHHVLITRHPSPLGCGKRDDTNDGISTFWKSKHFSKCNNYLINKSIYPIKWTLE